MKKNIKKISKAIVLLAMSGISSYAIDENEARFSDLISHGMKCELTDWMYPIVINIFNQKSLIEQQYIRKEIIENSLQIAGRICGVKEGQEKIASYLRKIANDENPINESPLLAMEDQNNPNYQLVTEIGKILYKIITGQAYILDEEVVGSKSLILLNMPELILSNKMDTLKKPFFSRLLPSMIKRRPRKHSM